MSGRATFLAFALVLAACGKEEIELAGETPDDVDAGGSGAEASASDTGMLSVGDSSLTCDSASASVAGCLPLGATCGANSDCCAGRCASGTCLQPGTCSAPGVPCAARADCCSGSCEPFGAGGARVCLATCHPEGSTCLKASDCCGLDCNGGTCGGAACARQDSDCATAAQCCSGVCSANEGKCVLAQAAPCRPAGEDCSSGGGAGCCGVCNDTTQRCDVGPGPCRLPGALCTQASDCCAGTCAPDTNGKQTCTSAPLPDGAGCTVGFQCNGGACTSNPPVCGALASACGPTGASCATAAGCCSGLCESGVCAPACTPPP
jgi:hypothetical protein